MKLSDDEVQKVKAVWQQVISQKDEASIYFYDRLFTIAPEIKPLFKLDGVRQRSLLMDILNLMATRADRINEIEETFVNLGIRHVKYGAEEKYYPVVRDVLMDVFDKFAPNDLDDSTKQIWTKLHGHVSKIMISQLSN